MASVYQLKGKFQDLLRPMVKKFFVLGITANQVTIAAMILSALSGLCLTMFPDSQWPWLLLPLVLLIRMALNAIDGMLAREHNMQSRLGAMLNELGDVISDTLLYLPFALIGGAFGGLVVIACILSVISEMTGVVAVQIGSKRRYDGPMGKSDRAVVFGAAGLLMGLGVNVGVWLDFVFLVVIILLAVTTFNRAAKALLEMPDVKA